MTDMNQVKGIIADHSVKLTEVNDIKTTIADHTARIREMATRAPTPDSWSTGARATTMPNGPPTTGADAKSDGACIRWSLPLTYGPLGMLGNAASMYRMFDDKLPSSNADFKFSGNNHGKGGVAWKGKTERYLIGKVPR